ncbi:MAG: NIL domain-containing protein [Clostridia bacterium]|nr:NIL domain-containing protein [Clostridia bacterium]
MLGASTRTFSGRAYGYMILDIPGGPDEMAAAVKYLSAKENITVQVETEYGRKEGD